MSGNLCLILEASVSGVCFRNTMYNENKNQEKTTSFIDLLFFIYLRGHALY